jgi:glucosyl-dolichyl phosphate glucuronosyltransferase
VKEVTVTICTWNRAELLDQTLTRMHTLRIPADLDWELLVVNNNCSDNTDAVIASHQGVLPVRRVFESKPGLSNARNCAAAAARGDLIIWTDDDVLVDEGWLTAVVGGPIEPRFPVCPDPDYLAAFPSLRDGFCGVDHDLPEGILPADRLIYGANMAFRRTVHLDLPFDTSFGMKPKQLGTGNTSIALAMGGWEEIDLLSKIRARGDQVVWVPAMTVKHYIDPRRMGIEYLAEYMKELGRGRSRCEGAPPGKKVFGVPRWLIREWLEATASHYYHRLKGNRRRALQQKGRQCELTGTIEGCLGSWYPGLRPR